MGGRPGNSGGAGYLHILRGVDLWGPVWDPPHAALAVAELLAEGPVLGLGVPAAVGVVEGHVQEEGPGWGGGVRAEAWLLTQGSPPPQEGTPSRLPLEVPVTLTASASPCLPPSPRPG